ncbi:MAG: DDE-type integrase/transposase/recombinase [Sulfurovum sp.]|nr:DDE-type integrase/transposase/recombinase [Sulfurovum sp.]
MKQHYHSNAKTNSHMRFSIQKSTLSNQALALQYGISIQTVCKWRQRDFVSDLSCRPHKIHYALNDLAKELIRIVRILTWMPLDDLVDTIQSAIPNATRSTVWRTLKHFGINTVPTEKKEAAKKFKDYQPGFLHMDVTYLPRIEGYQRFYLFVAIDRATRVMYYKVYTNRSADSANDFLKACIDFFPFKITHILTDNGNEFTNRFSQGRKEPTGNHRFDKLCKKLKIKHRLIEPFSPQTNGMVERVNGIIKEATVKVNTYETLEQMKIDLNRFLLYYLFNRRHGSLKKELGVRTPYEALQKWYNLEPKLFQTHPEKFKAYTFALLEQRGET